VCELLAVGLASTADPILTRPSERYQISPGPKTICSNGEHGGARYRSKTLNQAHEDQKVSFRAPFNYEIKQESVDDNNIIKRLHSYIRKSRQFRKKGGGITSTDKMRVICGQTVLTE